MKKHLQVWNDELHNIGVASQGSQHREIVERVSEIAYTVANVPINGAMNHLANDLRRLVQTHFALEKALMEKDGFHDLQSHAAEHLELLQQVANLHEDIAGSKREGRD